MAIWLCRAGRYGEYENKFLEDGRIYCTWTHLPANLEKMTSKQELQKFFIENDPSTKDKTALNWSSQVWAFSHQMSLGDWVVLPSKIQPTLHFAKIVGDCEYISDNENVFCHTRKVEWIAKNIPRADFDQDILYSFGAFMTICRIKQEERIKRTVEAFLNGRIAPRDENVAAEIGERDIEGDARSEITQLINQKLKGHGLTKLVDSILRAKGFTTYMSPPGPDKGVDILASSGVFGFGSPKICVQVKSSDTPIERTVLDQLVGVIRNYHADYGLLVSWNGFKSSVENERPNKFFEIRFWTHKEIVEEFLTYYEQMDEEIKEIIPLKKIWVVSNSEN